MFGIRAPTVFPHETFSFFSGTATVDERFCWITSMKDTKKNCGVTQKTIVEQTQQEEDSESV